MNKESLDIFGIKPYGEAINMAVEKSFDGVEGFLKLVCVPALGEVGLLLKDKIRYWRLNNILNILSKAKGKLDFSHDTLQIQANSRVALSIIENGSLIEEDELQELWAGLFQSSCTEDGKDDENLIFVDLLKQITLVEARILEYAIQNTRKIIYKNGLMLSESTIISCNDLINITNISDIQRLDRELDHLISLNLLSDGGLFTQGSGFKADDENLNVKLGPTALALNFYVRCQGCSNVPSYEWKLGVVTSEELEKGRKEKEDKEKRN